MLRLVSDESFNANILNGLIRRRPEMDIVFFEEVLAKGASDPEVLELAASLGRILLTHDQATMPQYACERLVQSKPMPGLFLLNNQISIGPAIDHLLLLDSCTDQESWNERIVYLPLT